MAKAKSDRADAEPDRTSDVLTEVARKYESTSSNGELSTTSILETEEGSTNITLEERGEP